MIPKQQAQQWLANNALILDTETTGLDSKAEIIEISIIDCAGNVLLDTLVKPTAPIPEDATRIHGITNEMVTNAPTWPEVYDLFVPLVEGRELVIYNADYDLRMIRQADERNDLLNIRTQADCAMLAYAEFYGQWDDYRGQWKWQRLGNAAKQQGVVIEGKAHRALADCQMTLGVIASMAGQWCTTMQRLKSKCGCPDCGSSLVQIG
ncbi:DNA polymerase III subunit epsilon [Shewanella algae]|uniref:3'-5' exonuclease n=1 Tax=Shewanella algae TaxID=38313 RepID=UPI00118344B4|nr:3'-5' exonuclease [Shewanella algae]TVK91281.1 DNA polymerase III subunit epsilon [Shewanella algae]